MELTAHTELLCDSDGSPHSDGRQALRLWLKTGRKHLIAALTEIKAAGY